MRRDYIEDKQRANQGNPQKFWRNLKTVVPGKSKQTEKINLIKDGQAVPSSRTADELNNFFANIGQNLGESVEGRWFSDGENNRKLLGDCLTNFDQVRTLVKDINVCKSSGLDGISSRVLRDALLVLVPQLVYLLNLSLSSGIYPTSWKVATVVPLYKGGGKSSMGNYRPISLLPVPGKILERIVHRVISNHLEANDLLTKFQAGFRKGYSTTSSIVSITNDIFEGINNQKVTMAVFVDLAKAFNTVNHVILLVKLIKLGITGTLLSWCRSYLSNRP